MVGHDAERAGAYSATLDTQEHPWCSVLARQLAAELELAGLDAQIFLRTPGGTYSAQMRELCDRVNAYTGSSGLVLSLHFNSSTDPSWAGGCVLHWPTSTNGQLAAELLAQAQAAAIGNRNRGAVAQSRSWGSGRPPLYLLQWTHSAACILEPFAGSNAADATAGNEAQQNGTLAYALAQAVVDIRQALGNR